MTFELYAKAENAGNIRLADLIVGRSFTERRVDKAINEGEAISKEALDVGMHSLLIDFGGSEGGSGGKLELFSLNRHQVDHGDVSGHETIIKAEFIVEFG